VRFFIRNFGCRATQADGAALCSALAAGGHQQVGECAAADVVILNSCTVTAAADEDVRQAVRRVRRENPAARILITGCYAQRAPQELASLEGVVWVVGNTHRAEIPKILNTECGTLVGDIREQREFTFLGEQEALEDRTRPNLKIQDGCNHRCSFCIIPFVRGPSRSAPPDRVVEQVRRLAERYREVVLSGVNLGRWGREPGLRMRLVGLLRRLLEETGVERLRLSSIEPMDLTDELLELIASTPRIARHLHVPLQSGSDAVLKRMRRWYRTRHYADRMRKIREYLPDAAIGADVMVGFPAETEAEFEESRAFIAAQPFTYLHVFTYSERPGTPASAMPGRIPVAERKRRNRILRELGAAFNLEFRRRMAGRSLSAVTIEDGRSALTTNYLKVKLAVAREPNRLIEVRFNEDLIETGAGEAG